MCLHILGPVTVLFHVAQTCLAGNGQHPLFHDTQMRSSISGLTGLLFSPTADGYRDKWGVVWSCGERGCCDVVGMAVRIAWHMLPQCNRACERCHRLGLGSHDGGSTKAWVNFRPFDTGAGTCVPAEYAILLEPPRTTSVVLPIPINRLKSTNCKSVDQCPILLQMPGNT